jgi:glycine cleavage system H protein
VELPLGTFEIDALADGNVLIWLLATPGRHRHLFVAELTAGKPRAVRTAQVKMQVMQVRYSQDHEYVIVEDGVGTVGITNYAQERLSEVIFVDLPRVGAQVKKGGAVGVVESVKAASDLYSPVSGEILGVNEVLTGKPQLVNEDAEGAGWIYKIKLAEPSELDTLLDREGYLAYARKQG